MMTYLRRAVEEELPQRDKDYEVMARDLTGSANLTAYVRRRGLRLFTTPKGLAVAVAGPDWSRGWKSVFTEEHAYDVLSWFFHLAAQYVHRGRLGSAIAGLAVFQHRGCDFYGQWLDGRRSSVSQVPVDESLDALVSSRASKVHTNKSAAGRRVEALVQSVNGLDPFVHRATFQLVRSHQLFGAGFSREAVTALDGVVSVCGQFAQHRLQARIQSRDDIGTALGLPQSYQPWPHFLNELRSNHGAHPSWWKWWDFDEMFDEDFDVILDTVNTLYWRLLQSEKCSRAVEPYPDSWSAWFVQNADVLFEAVWWGDMKATVPRRF